MIDVDQLNKSIQFEALNPSYDQVNVNVISMDPLAHVNCAYHIFQQIEKKKFVVISPVQIPKVSALYSHKSNKSFLLAINKIIHEKIKTKKKAKFDRFCDHCKMRGHSIEQYFKINGYLEKFAYLKNKLGSTSSKVANVVATKSVGNTPLDVDDSGVSEEQSGSLDLRT